MKYKVGDKVRIKGLDWYNKHTNEYGYIVCGNLCFNSHNKHWCGKIVTIEIVHRDCYLVKENDAYWNDIMIEGLVEEKPSNENKEQLLMIRPYTMEIVSHKDYEIIQIDGKFFLEKKKPKYPQTYEECCKVLGYSGNYNMILTTDVDNKLFDALYKLKVCRDAYWKIAGEEMGLGKPWEPDWENKEEEKYTIEYFAGMVYKDHSSSCSRPFAFPTPEMRDAFKESEEISKLIEECKELL